MQRREPIAILSTLFGACLWGIIWYPINALETRGVSGLWTTFLVFSAISVAFLPFLRSYRKKIYALRPKAIFLLAFFGGLTNLLFFLALTQTSVVRALMFFYLSPIWNLIAARISKGQKLTCRKITVISIALAGAAGLLGVHNFSLLTWNLGDSFALTSGICFAISIIGLQMSPQTPSWVLTGLHWMGTALIALLGFIILRPAPPPFAEASNWLPLLLLFAFANQATASLCILFALTRLESYRVNVLMLFEIIVGSVSYALWSMDVIKLHEWLGIGLIITASLLDNLRNRRPTSMPAEQQRDSLCQEPTGKL